MFNNRRLYFLGLAALSISPLFATPYTFTTIAAPQGTSIVANSINNAGEIVGSIRASGASLLDQQAFVYQNGVFQYIDSVDSSATGVNNLGQVVGWDHNGAFLYNGAQLTSLPSSVIQPSSINDKDQIIAYSSAIDEALGVIDLKTGAVQQIANPYYPTATSNPSAINNAGEVVGIMPAIPNRAFLYQDGTYTTLTPSNDPNSWADPTGINNEGQVVGTFLDTNNPPPGLLGLEQGFIYTNGVFQFVTVPGAIFTEIADINDDGDILGTYADSNDVMHTFVGTPLLNAVPEPSSVVLLGSGLLAIALLGRKKLGIV